MRHDAFFSILDKPVHELRRVFELEIGNEKRTLAYDVTEFKGTRFSSFTFFANVLFGVFVTHFFKGNNSLETLIFD
ncbi:MAG: hypothetical protein ACK56F_30870, partial [bacterium]